MTGQMVSLRRLASSISATRSATLASTAAKTSSTVRPEASMRGRIGTYYALPATTGCALVASIAPEGIVAEAVNVYGEIVARSGAEVSRSPGERRVAETLQ